MLKNRWKVAWFLFAAIGQLGHLVQAQIVIPASGIIGTVIGNGTAGYSGDGGLAVNAEIYRPWGVAVDAAGNIYLADNGNDRVRKVEASTGIITTIAGNGTIGYSGDGGLAVNAELDGPTGLALDGDGNNIYFADTGNNVVREVYASNGVINTVAGGGPFSLVDGTGNGWPATYVQLIQPEGLAVDPYGNIYIRDPDIPPSVRLVTDSTGIISTVAGITAYGPFPSNDPCSGGVSATSGAITGSGLGLDPNDDLYVAQDASGSDSSCVLLVSAATGQLSPVAGNGTPGYAGDKGAATAAELDGPTGVALDSSGDVYIVDLGNHLIREVTASTGIISTVAGGVRYVRCGPLLAHECPTLLPAGYNGDGGPAIEAELNGPQAVALDSAGNVYIADWGNNRIRVVGN